MDQRLFAVGDIHGCFDTFSKLIDKIKPVKSDKIILLGDYIDRGNQSKQVLDLIMELQKELDIVTLTGNHEAMLLDALRNEELLPLWFYNGGFVTMKSFGITSLNDLDPVYVDFLRKLLPYFEFENFLFVHAGFNDKISNPFDDKYEMIWARREKYLHPELVHKTIVHGHTPIPLKSCKDIIESNCNVINIDTGCVFLFHPGYGYLSAIELFSKKLYTVKNIEKV